MKVNVVAIDDHEVALIGLRQMLGASEKCALVAGHHTLAESLALIRDPSAPSVDVVLLDLRLGDGSDPYFNATRLQETGVAVLAYSSLESPYLVRRALQAGVVGIIEKTASGT